jgi:2-oxoisovalerate dehydrogenase E1 component
MQSETIAAPTKERLLALYRQMLLIRLTEEQLARARQRGLVHGACHTYVGQEAVAVGVCAHLRKEDVVFSTHRGHGHALAKGVSPRQLIAELLGRETGCSHGRGGSMHIFAPEVGMMGTSGIVGPCILQAAGGGYSFKLLRSDQVAVAFFGDGAANNGAFHEGLNMASIWKLPVLFVCENNQFATEVPFSYSAGNPNVASRAVAYGLPGVEVNGNDVQAVYQAAGAAIKRARQGGGATLLECKTYRTRPHSEGMEDFTYRTREEVEQWKARCPIQQLRRALLEEAHAEEAELADIEEDIKSRVAEAQTFAEESPWPEPATATAHVYAEAKEPAARVSTNGSHASTPREISYMQATLEALDEEMAQNPRIFVMGEGIGRRGGNFKTTAGLFEKYGAERLCDTPICERGFVGLSTGAAMTGTRPVIDFMFVDFVLDAMGELINQVAKIQYMSNGRLKMPVLLRGCVGIGHSAATHHSGSYYSIFTHVPGFRVVVPSTPYDAKGLLKRALRCDDPVVFLEHRELLGLKGPVPEGDCEIEFGQASVVRAGTDVTVVAVALMVRHALKAAETLAKEGISVEVIDPRTLSPLDLGTILESVKKTGRLLVADEAFGPCGVAGEIVAQVVNSGFDELDAPIRRVTGAFTPTPYSPPLESAVVPNPDVIAKAIRELAAE